ncbi:MAG: hypothetical protein SFV15_25885 [Polyangiaceae bacterium]|nr:hypothetical protein [Polyangiaceae bacterium]
MPLPVGTLSGALAEGARGLSSAVAIAEKLPISPRQTPAKHPGEAHIFHDRRKDILGSIARERTFTPHTA